MKTEGICTFRSETIGWNLGQIDDPLSKDRSKR